MRVGERVALREVLVALESGSRPKGGVKGIESGVPSLGGEHLDANGGFRLDRVRYVPREFAASMRRGRVAVGDVLVVKDGATTGKVSLVRHSFPYKDAVVNEHVFLCRCDERVDPRYVFWYLFSAEGQRQILSDFRGAAQGGISQRFADLVEIPLRPIAEQRKIVAEIENQFSRLDEAVVNLKRVKANLRRYKDAVLKAAVTGRLVPLEGALASREKRGYESGDQLLQRILKDRRARGLSKGKYKEPASASANLPELPLGWTWATIESLAVKVSDGVHKKPVYRSSGVPFVTVKNLTAREGISFEELNYVSEEDHREFCKRTHPERGDLLVSKDGTLGVVRLVNTDRAFSIFVSVALVKPVLKEMSRYLEIALESPILQGQMVPKGSGLQHIHLEDLRQDCVPVPPLSEQRRIVAEVDRRLSIVREVEAEVEANLTRAVALRHATLQRWYGGNKHES